HGGNRVRTVHSVNDVLSVGRKDVPIVGDVAGNVLKTIARYLLRTVHVAAEAEVTGVGVDAVDLPRREAIRRFEGRERQALSSWVDTLVVGCRRLVELLRERRVRHCEVSQVHCGESKQAMEELTSRRRRRRVGQYDLRRTGLIVVRCHPEGWQVR